MGLKEYRNKRTLKTTPEPSPASGRSDEQYLVFVVHKHAARRLHYDLRLEMQGVLKSFAVPKGPTLDPSTKRLAVHVEDHPFDYKDFEGIIPKGNYGAGKVIIWDRGYYSSPFAKDKQHAEKLLLDGLKKGDLKFVLAGTKLKGKFALVKTKWSDNSWLLIKDKDAYTSTNDILLQDKSVFSDKTIDELSDKGSLEPETQQQQTGQQSFEKPAVNEPASPMPHNVEPMLATAADKPFNHADWIFEVKWDGYRAIAEVNKSKVALLSRNHISLATKFSPIVQALQKMELQAVLDGEIVIVDPSGKPNFQKLQDYPLSKGGVLVYYVFDVLFNQERDLTALPLVERKDILKSILPANENIKYSQHIWKDGTAFFDAARQKGVEGIVAKHSQSPYLPGIRSKQWLKIKNHVTQDCVIAGFTAPRGSRKYLGSLVLGAYNKGVLVCIGHSGGGFEAETPKTMYDKLKPLIRKTSPFKTPPPQDGLVTWVKPLLVCEVAFAGWTKEALMRQPRFVRLRNDKGPRETVISDTDT